MIRIGAPSRIAATQLKRAGILVGAVLVSSCSLGPDDVLTFYNHSNQALTLVDCDGQRLRVPAGETKAITRNPGIILGAGSYDSWRCFQKRPFMIERQDGTKWSYRLWFNRDAMRGMKSAERKNLENEVRRFTQKPRPSFPLLKEPRFKPPMDIRISVDPAGTLIVGRWELTQDISDQSTATANMEQVSPTEIRYRTRSMEAGVQTVATGRLVFSMAKQPRGFPIKPMPEEVR